MKFVSYDKICRYCLGANGARASYAVTGDLDFKGRSEYEFAKTLESWLRENKNVCEFCGSPFVEGNDIVIDNIKLYDLDRLVKECKESGGELFIWKVFKKEQRIEINVGGEKGHDPQFIKECFNKLIKIVDALPEHKLIYHQRIGDLLICFTGKYNYDTESFNPIIQKFYCTGLSYDEVIRCINYQLDEFGMQELIR